MSAKHTITSENIFSFIYLLLLVLLLFAFNLIVFLQVLVLVRVTLFHWCAFTTRVNYKKPFIIVIIVKN